ncbi:hypothetical protein Ancab_022818, partial [Ancistrocladus abbreviatus]
WKVLLLVRYIQTDPENYEDPLFFNRDRWDAKSPSGRYPFFGCGLRSCPANMLVRMHLAVFLHHISVGY